MFKKCTLASVMLLFCLFMIQKVIAAPQPVVYYTFDKLDATVTDASGNGNDGTPKGDVKLSNDGKLGKSFEFNGTDAYIELERVVQDDFTLMAWIKTDKPGIQLGNQGYQGSGLIWSDVGGAANDFILAVLGTKLSFFCGSPDLSVNSDQDIVTGEWLHVAGTRSLTESKISIYIDGKHEKTIDHANKNPLDALPTIAIGGNVLDNRYYTGLVDEVKLFDVALTESEIKQVSVTTPVESIGKLAVTWAKLK
ncbi:LamG domain-containing protein [bacterium]|nr:LamG domain-containing protein [bacterium]